MSSLIVLSSAALASELLVGTYGRATVSTDLDGGAGESADVVAYPPRLHKGPYAEIDIGFQEGPFRAVMTPAISGMPFHYDGTWDADLAVRNLYTEARLPLGGGEVLPWAGSRMLRGDDVFLLDAWPLDNLNLMGGGARFEQGDTTLGVHVGMNRLQGEDWQVQDWTIPTPGGVGGEPVQVLDRQRMIGAASGARTFHGPVELRVKVYGELHRLPAGQRVVEDDQLQALPADRGSTAGLQLSTWGWAPESHASFFYRHSTGLAATGLLYVPTDGFATDLTVAAAREDLWALSVNHEAGPLSVGAGAILRYARDADGIAVDVDDRWELSAVLRPTINVGQYGGLALEASEQWLRPNGLNPRTDSFDVPRVTRLSVIPLVHARPGTYGRPQIHAIYSLSLLNEGAVAWFDPLDSRARPVQHYVGVGAEWWLNSISYGR